jgi:hypothetical protein
MLTVLTSTHPVTQASRKLVAEALSAKADIAVLEGMSEDLRGRIGDLSVVLSRKADVTITEEVRVHRPRQQACDSMCGLTSVACYCCFCCILTTQHGTGALCCLWQSMGAHSVTEWHQRL